MREIYAHIAERMRDRRRFAVATLVAMRGAAPAPAGTSLVVDEDGSFVGNIGAGCHEADIIERAQGVMRDRRALVVEYALDDDVLDGSICGASLEVALWVPPERFVQDADAIVLGREPVRFSIEATGASGVPQSFAVEIPRKRILAIVGATDLAAYLAEIGRRLDFEVTVIDPRPPFATKVRHPAADCIVVAWPERALPDLLHAGSALVVVAHDVKIDTDALRAGLHSQASYIGVLGSRRAQRARFASLREEGFDDAAIARIHGPAGLDLGGHTPAQTAVSILADVLATLNGSSGRPLHEIDGPIHRTVMLR
ncbi:MAG: XdhC family protein [Vulcanimicrobiaceae bacterium]